MYFIGFGLYLIWLFMAQPYDSYIRPESVELSDLDTVALAREFYACGGDCPYYRVLSAEKEENGKYVGQMADICGVDVWKDFSSELDEEKAAAMFMALSYTDKFVCTGRFQRYAKPFFWECCLDSDNLVFQALECRQTPRTYEDRCKHNRWIFEDLHNRSLDSLPQAAEEGEAEAQYLLGDIYEQGIPCRPRDKALAEYWYERAASQGHRFARASLEAMRREAEEAPDEADEEDRRD